MKYLVIAALALACTRTELGRAVDCGDGTRVVVNFNEFCVYPGQQGVACPEALPFPTEYAEATFCAVEANPHPALLAAALEAQRAAADAGPVDAGFDATSVPDSAPDAQEDQP